MKRLVRSAIKSCPPLYRQINRFRGWRLHDPEKPVPWLEVGGDGGPHNYGAWVVPKDLLSSTSVVYCVGVGDDISFDIDLIERFGCIVHAFDPTPTASDYARCFQLPLFRFYDYGLGATDGVGQFQHPAGEDASFTKPLVGDAGGEARSVFALKRL